VAAAEIAGAAEEPAHLAGPVVVVDAEVALDLALADAAAAVLPREERVVFLDSDAVVIFEVVLALAFAAILTLLQLACRILMPLLTAFGVDALLVGLVPGTIVGARLLSIFLVFGIALLAALVALVLRTHGMLALEKGAHRRGKSAFTRYARTRAGAVPILLHT